ncbi:PfaD family polyunsaturated fatty acid/polyketide biosynthesis protein [Streptomyces sp. NPDC047461]|uniref:PfaD family polyunsaturated fatty acid/polyketide biosynthesis protein n=1 Tax=Streptomyces sp. NPDC047461 TaxID=3155619 RepID=UPI003409B793
MIAGRGARYRSIHRPTSPEPDIVLRLARPVPGEGEDIRQDRLRVLASQERRRAEGFLRSADRDEYIRAHWLLRHALSEGTSVPPEDWDFTRDRYDKPRIAERFGDRREFSLSHSAGVALVAISTGRPVGVDIERLADDDPPPLRSCLTPAERTTLSALPDRDRYPAFVQLWTLKEALAKAMGIGLRLPFGDVDFTWQDGRPVLRPTASVVAPELWTCHRLDAPVGLRAALCVRGPRPRGRTYPRSTHQMTTLDGFAPAGVRQTDGEALGSAAFRRRHGVRLAYVSGSMYKGIASAALVARMGRSGLLGYFGTGGLRPEQIDEAITRIRAEVGADGPFGMNLLAHPDHPRREEQTVDLFLARDVRRVEAAAFLQPSAALVRYRLTGVHRRSDGSVAVPNSLLGKVSRPESARAFLSPAPAHLVSALLHSGALSAQEAALAPYLPMADDLCVEADSGGHTDQRQLITVLPEIVRLRDTAAGVGHSVCVGAAGGLGTPEAIAAAFLLGADFVLTGSINQCTPEAGTADDVKDLLQSAGVQDTMMVPAGDMLEIGARAQVLGKGLFFPARANKLYDLYRRYDSLEAIDAPTRRQLQERFFQRRFEEIWQETASYYATRDPGELARADADPKHRMALVFKWYFVQSTRLAMSGSSDRRVDYQVACGPAMGALNGYLAGTELENWRARHPDTLADLLMTEAARLLRTRLAALVRA